MPSPGPAARAATPGAAARRARDTQALRAVLPPCEPFDAWVARSGGLAPDFARLPARTGLWSPTDGVAGPAAWPAQREVLRARWRRWVCGAVPRAGGLRAPGRVVAVSTTGGVQVRHLVVGDGWAVRARLLLPVPAAGLALDVPVHLVQTSGSDWGELAVQAALERGWGACVVSAGDGDDDTEAVQRAFPGSVAGRLAWRAWALSRVLDALEEQPGVDARRVLVGGHSRNGKTALLAAAFDDRFAGVVASSSGVLGAIPARLCTDRHFGEGVELLTRHYPGWYAPGLRWFAGREHRLPTDAHELLALVAPRPVLVSTAVEDPVDRVPAARAAVAAAREAWSLLGAPDALHLALRPGGHRADAAAVRAQQDWAQDVLGAPGRTRAVPAAAAARRAAAPAATPVAWPAHPPRPGRPLLRGAPLRAAVTAALGAERSGAGPRPTGVVPRPRAAGSAPRTVEGVEVTLLPARREEDGRPRGLVLWLGPPCAATGWRAGYEQAEPLPAQLAADGWDVACHDPVASGPRHAEVPGAASSPLGRMTADAAQVARTAMAAVGADRTWVAAYGTGALVALHLAALGGVPLAGAVLVAPTCADPLLRAVPGYGLADLLAVLAGAPALVLDPAWDPLAPRGAVAVACRAAGVERVALQDWHRLSAATRSAVVAWMAGRAPAPVPA